MLWTNKNDVSAVFHRYLMLLVAPPRLSAEQNRAVTTVARVPSQQSVDLLNPQNLLNLHHIRICLVQLILKARLDGCTRAIFLHADTAN